MEEERSAAYTLAKAAYLLDVSEEEVVRLARRGKFRGTVGPEGWTFDALSFMDFAIDRSVQNTVNNARRFSDPLAETIETLTYVRFDQGYNRAIEDVAPIIRRELEKALEKVGREFAEEFAGRVLKTLREADVESPGLN